MRLAITVVFAVTWELLLVLSSFDSSPMIQVAGQQGFVSIDCGGSSTSYTDSKTGLFWVSDSNGFGLENVSHAAKVSSPAKYPWLSSIRIFEGAQSKYCYEFDDEKYGIVQSQLYLVRASFWIGDKPSFSSPEEAHISFQLLINANVWDSIDISLPQKEALVKEVYVVAVLQSLSVCVEGRNKTAFISALELRPLSQTFTAYVSSFMETQQNALKAMFLYSRLDLGSPTDVRYPVDAYDRIWSADTRQGLYVVTSTPVSQSTSRTFHVASSDDAPSAVLQTALVGNSSFNVTFNISVSKSYHFFYTFSCAEISNNVSAKERVFSEETINPAGALGSASNIIDLAIGDYATFNNTELVGVNAGGFLTFSFERNSTSLLGPLVNALELFYISQDNMSLGTYKGDVYALKVIKESLSRFDSWRGDPCLPYAYEWLSCDSAIQPRITNLSLQNRGITSEIPAEIGDLKALVEINLRGNNLSGSIPSSIAQLPNLTTLFLEDNNLSGTIPQELLDKRVTLRLAGNPLLCEYNSATYCDQQPVQTKNNESKKSHTLIVGVLAPTCAVVLILLASILFFHFRRKGTMDGAAAITHEEVIKYSNLAQHFTFQQIERMTNNFKTKLGAGGFGDVFLGVLSTGLNVAVKISSLRREAQEGSEFLNEVALLSRMHHKNLVEFVGYCIHPRLVLVYEYMAKGSLEKHLHGKDNIPLSWRERLKIIVGAAQGLEYLHKGCKPPIIHRDVKCSNILLDEELEGKISDFGISRSKLADTQMTVTNVQGTVGYIAPEYAEFRITEKVDVFAFGVVLLEVVSGRCPFEGSRHIVNWVRPLLNRSQIQYMADPTIAADYNMSSMWKVLEVAMACVEQDAQRRPDMHEVSSELQSALSFELQNESISLAYDASNLPLDTETVLTR